MLVIGVIVLLFVFLGGSGDDSGGIDVPDEIELDVDVDAPDGGGDGGDGGGDGGDDGGDGEG